MGNAVCLRISWFVLSLVLLSTVAEAAVIEDTKAIVTALGKDTTAADLGALEKDPALAISVLVEELTSVNDTELDSDKEADGAWHVVWCIRALRYLTSVEFRAPTKLAIGDLPKSSIRRELLLKKENSDGIPFFAVWMSRDKVYLAPRSAQIEIISQWQKWWHSQTTSKTQTFSVERDPEFWYF